jgi:hypothetical protein
VLYVTSHNSLFEVKVEWLLDILFFTLRPREIKSFVIAVSLHHARPKQMGEDVGSFEVQFLLGNYIS